MSAGRREVGDAIGADSVDADLGKSLPMGDVVGRPRDDTRADGVRAHDQIFVDELDLLPKVLRTRLDQRARWIEVASDLENTGPNRREKTLDGFYDPVVERMDGAIRARLADAANHQWLDVGFLDLDENGGAISYRMQHFGERWNEDPVCQREPTQLVDGKVAQSGFSSIAQVTGLDNRVVVYNDGAVTCRVDVQLDSLGTELDSADECRDRVLWESVVRTPMGNRDRGAGRSNQAWPLLS